MVSREGLPPNPENIRAVANYPVPQTVKQAHSFLALASYFRRIVKNFSLIVKPLYDLTKKNASVNFGKEQFMDLKRKVWIDRQTGIIHLFSECGNRIAL